MRKRRRKDASLFKGRCCQQLLMMTSYKAAANAIADIMVGVDGEEPRNLWFVKLLVVDTLMYVLSKMSVIFVLGVRPA
ncbi:hypothetical protein V6N13_019951 [Hibiscus sabdariffa]